MDEQITNGAANQLLQYGPLGIFCLFLIVALFLLWQHGKQERMMFYDYLEKRDNEFLKRVDRFSDILEKYAVKETIQTQALSSLEKVIQSIAK